MSVKHFFLDIWKEVCMFCCVGGTKLNFKGNKILHPQIEKTALGAEEDMEVTFLENTEELFHFAKENKLSITSIQFWH